ncbi:pseudaminic acid cytidylyltransferase [Acinetobacter bereziniae]|uniref:pseudaminic acid cytidylyltransferase n=2 Tax=Acinetobacter bereziniae TaxID=106648 RepID=UPI001580F0BB|nr:pseudaminic acid cytidylyltransferase [Acinetobacter bereziniae]NUF65232.1 pseudaminic acid cytidylyltransferase [Acinetobacter bereziniae]NUG09589.1 pseudaminic acid cytidylyltransferase [Acinetobacter bereziniae]NUG65896.1 pseudaminic acid cytidylyltransferase [Acinetobacter bereziniae]NUG71905.1 pseudaminic acid cytidylyltransferase [Acinetobacter bereziniae]
MNLAVIPARGGSKRIPHKNIKFFLGKPMIAWSIEAALSSGIFDEVWVSTDDIEIAEISKRYGAKVPFIRPDKISDDFSTTADVMAHAVGYYKNEFLNIPDLVCCIYATAPFISIKDLLEGAKSIKKDDLDYVFSATKFSFPIQRALKIKKDGKIDMISPSFYQKRSQDCEEYWHDAGQFYWGKSSAWLEKKDIFLSDSGIVSLPNYRVQDIDTLDDWVRAELMAKKIFEKLKK